MSGTDPQGTAPGEEPRTPERRDFAPQDEERREAAGAGAEGGAPAGSGPGTGADREEPPSAADGGRPQEAGAGQGAGTGQDAPPAAGGAPEAPAPAPEPPAPGPVPHTEAGAPSAPGPAPHPGHGGPDWQRGPAEALRWHTGARHTWGPGQGWSGPAEATRVFGAAPPPESAAYSAPGGAPGAPGGPGGPGTPPPPWAGPGQAPPPPGPQDPGAKGKRKRPGTVAVAAATALVTSLIVGPAAALVTTWAVPGGGGSISSLADGNQGSSTSTGSVSKVAEKVLPSVVSIETGSGSGSGVVIGSDGQILTNAHVVAGAQGDTVRVRFNDGSSAEARILGTDSVSDIAVLQAEDVSGLTPATLGDSSKVEVGADVVAIGSPLGLSGTVTSGVVSAVDRPVNTGVADGGEQGGGQQDPFGPQQRQEPQATTSTVINAIQTDAPINPGNSGGPLINMNGEVIGINTAIAGIGGPNGEEAGSIGLGFAIPVDQAEPIAEQLIENGSADYAAIDATVSPTQSGDGVRVVQPNKGGAADQAGLEKDDVITSVDGKGVSAPDELIAAIRAKQPGDEISIGYERDGKADQTEVTLSAQSSESIGG
ncbi:S1C family serine protease [Nocardiopsis potens]|uniref:S1C family serine protease n=1 Tax=Nocardiopsis potens TaxID=1246458 RepID=UPI000346300C|nr:trypsin-like peptidase domain-containing protein [Nocardiopsis potens]